MRRSLETIERAVAKRKLVDLQRDLTRVDASAGKMPLGNLCDRLLATVAHQSPNTLEQKHQIAKRIKIDWPGGSNMPIGKVTPSAISAFLAGYKFGASSYNHHLLFFQAAFRLAVADKLLTQSPVADLTKHQRAKPIRRTPTFEEFRRIVAGRAFPASQCGSRG